MSNGGRLRKTAAGARAAAPGGGAGAPGKRTRTGRAGRRAKPPSFETDGHQERSWASPSTAEAAEPVLVGATYFRTRETALDAADQAVLQEIAVAYAPWAKQHQGLRGEVVGHADPRTSIEPNNQELSEKRAFWTATRLAGALAVATHLDQGAFEIKHAGAGAAQVVDDAEDAVAADDDLDGVDDAEDASAPAEGNSLGPLRRADILLAGQASAPTIGPFDPPKPAVDDRPRPPVMQEWERGYEKYLPEIEAVNKETIQAVAARMIGVLVTGGTMVGRGGVAQAFEGADEMLGVMNLGVIPRIGFKKPPWWDGRASAAGLVQPTGRGGLRGDDLLVFKSKLMVRDFIETMKWQEAHFNAGDGSYVMMILEIKKSKPDEAKIAEYVTNLEYLRFMIDETQNEAEEVHKLADH